jgi:hypothetical protein
MNRRTVLLSGAALLAGCAPGATVTPAQVITDIENIGATFSADLSLLGPTLGIPAATVASIKTIVADIVSVGSSVASGVTAGGTGVTAVFNDVDLILTAVAPFAVLLPGPWTIALAAAQILLPTLASLVNVTLPAPASAFLAVRAALPVMTAAQAEAFFAKRGS